MSQKLACIILAAGKGTRMKSESPKPLHPIAGQPMIRHVIDSCKALGPDKIVAVLPHGYPELDAAVPDCIVTRQQQANGTGGAALAAKPELKDFDGDILVVFGDSPLIKTETLRNIVDTRRSSADTGLVFSAFEAKDPTGYGRMILNKDGSLDQIIEHKDASPAELDITLCNGGVMCADGARLFDWLDQIGNDNAQQEYYLVDLPEIARIDNRLTRIAQISETETAGINSRADQASVEKLFQIAIREKVMANGVTLIDPDTVYFSADTDIAADVTIGPGVFFGPGVVIETGVVIHPYSHLEGATIRQNAVIGPYARIRPGSEIGEKAKVGNFVELKNTKMDTGAKASHLTYLGDAQIGARANIGAGTITCNFDGYNKFTTTIGEGAFIGSNTALIAPVTVGRNALIAAGSTITSDVDDEALAFARARQSQKEGRAKQFRDQQKKK